MKKISLLLIITALVLNIQSARAQRSLSDLAGKWESTDGSVGSIEFLDGGKVQGNINGMQIPPVNYTIDLGRTPIWFNVVVTPGNTINGLLEFIDDNTVKYQVLLSGNTSYDFTASPLDPIFILKRKTQ